MVAFSTSDYRRGFALLALAVLTACGGGTNGSPQAPATAMGTTRAAAQSDLEIAQLLYLDTQRTPAGFYKDTTPSFSGYVATAHLKNTDLSGAASAPPYELCTDDWAVALDWSDQSATAMSASMLVETNATTRYNEFSRLRAGMPQGYLRTRVYRCSYLDRSAVDLRVQNGAAGVLNQKPLHADELRQLAEYLWQFTTYNNYGSVVLKSSGTTLSSGLQHTLVIASLGTTTNGCDRVSVIGWGHSVNAQSGAVTRDTQVLWEFGARRISGLVELCNPF